MGDTLATESVHYKVALKCRWHTGLNRLAYILAQHGLGRNGLP